MNDILRIVLERNQNRKVLNKDDIKKICEIIIRQHNYSESLQISFSKTCPYNNRVYASTKVNEVIFYMEGIEEAQGKKYNSLLSVDSLDGGKVDYYNFVILEAIFHEFAHVRQNNKLDKCNSDIETKLFKLSAELMLYVIGFYRKHYDIITIETDAYARGLIESYKIYASMPDAFISEHDKKLYGGIVMNNFLSKYHISSNKECVKSPSEILLEKIDVHNVSRGRIDIDAHRKLITSPNNLTIYKKLLVGLPLSYAEAAYVNMLESCVSHGEKVNFIKKLQKKL